MMNSYLPGAPPQLKDRINPDHWAGFVQELNDAGTPNADWLLTCGVFVSCTCCLFLPKIKSEFEHKVCAPPAWTEIAARLRVLICARYPS
jgi:hypothetical protein